MWHRNVVIASSVIARGVNRVPQEAASTAFGLRASHFTIMADATSCFLVSWSTETPTITSPSQLLSLSRSFKISGARSFQVSPMS